MKRIIFWLVAFETLAGVAHLPPASGQDDGASAPIYAIKIPTGDKEAPTTLFFD